jgi:hypothetical protein
MKQSKPQGKKRKKPVRGTRPRVAPLRLKIRALSMRRQGKQDGTDFAE